MLDLQLEDAIKKIKLGDKNGFIVFYNKTFQFVYARTKSLFSNNIECKEFLKSVYLSTFLHINEYDNTKELEHWLMSRVLSSYQDVLTLNHLDPMADISKLSGIHAPVLQSASDTTYCMSLDYCAPVLSDAIPKLPALPRIIFLAFYHDGLTLSEISSAFHANETAILWELNQAKNFLMSSYLENEANGQRSFYPFSLSLIFQASELYTKEQMSTKEYARLVWEQIVPSLTFQRRPKKKSFSLPLFCCFSVLLLAMILIHMYSNGYFSTAKTTAAKESAVNNIYENTESTNDLLPSSTTTIKDENGNITTYDENGSEIATPSSDTTSTSNTNSSSTQSSEAAANHTVSEPTVHTPSVSEPSVTAPTVTEPSVSAPAVPTPSE